MLRFTSRFCNVKEVDLAFISRIVNERLAALSALRRRLCPPSDSSQLLGNICTLSREEDQYDTLPHSSIFLVDVRSVQEISDFGIIPTALHVPLPLLTDLLDSSVDEEEFLSAVACDHECEMLSASLGPPTARAGHSITPTSKRWLIPSPLPPRKPNPKEHTLVFYCHAGVRSLLAARTAMEDLNFTSVCHFPGGMKAWLKA